MDIALQSPFGAEALGLLILLAGTILLYLSIRERYLVPWIAGWAMYSLSKLFVAISNYDRSLIWVVLGNAFLPLAAALFATAILIYVGGNRRMLLIVVWTLAGIGALLGATTATQFPDSSFLAVVFWFCWSLELWLAAWQLVKFARGRGIIGHWILAATLFFLHVGPRRTWSNVDVVIDLLLGISMMMVVLDGSKLQVRRLAVLNSITRVISGSEEFNSILEIALQELMSVAGAKSAWFRILEEGRLNLVVHKNLSPAFVAGVPSIDLSQSMAGNMLRAGTVGILPVRQSLPQVRARMIAEGIHHLVVVPVLGKSSPIGVMALGMAHYRNYTDDDYSFLKAAANQLGLAAENRRLVQQLVRSRNEWASTFNSMPDHILVHDSAYRILRTNLSLLTRLRRSKDSVIGRHCREVLPGAGVKWSFCPYCELPETSATTEIDPCFGGFSVVSTSAYSDEHLSEGGTVHVIKDTTEIKAAEERYRTLFNHMQEGVFVSTPEGRVTDCNEAFVRMLGYGGKEEVLKLDVGKSLYAHHTDRTEFLRQMAHYGFVRNFEYVLRRKDGTEVNVIESSFATRSDDGKIERYQGVVLDLTEKKKAEDEIRRRNRELHALNNIAVTFNQSFDLEEILHLTMLQIAELFANDTAGVYLFEEESGAMRRKAGYGYRSSLVTGQEMFTLPPDFVEQVKQRRLELINSRTKIDFPEIIQKIVQAEKLSSWLWVILWRKEKVLGLLGTSSRTVREFSASEENVLIAIGRQLATTIEKIHLYDETRKAYEDLRRTQEQLLQSEKMSAVGQLISGVAHELNNPLTAIIGYTQLLETEELQERSSEYVQKLLKQAQRTQKIVQNLLSFARQHKPHRTHVDLRNVIEDTIALRDYDLKVNNILVERDFHPTLPSVIADPHQLEQVYLNIINNAADAMMENGRGGLLTIRVYAENGHVVCEFHDTGPGINDTKHAFDPFYTTKSVGKGTGLGLSICYGIVKEHGGEISAQNHPHGGAQVQLRLPVAVGERPLTEGERIVARRESRLDGRVLVVDDEEIVLDYERDVLTAAGLEVIVATSGEQALEYLQQQSFDIVLLDSKMPGTCTSEDIYRWIQKYHPDQAAKTVLVLSNVSDPGVRVFVDATKIMCLVKPFEVPDLLALVRRVLRMARVTMPTLSN
ncbi:MAG TPA: ATP-binding protein [Candidatus Angelobacter sp.]|jgi:two-component system NtrC family sensor kinase|nr:ATP-binding protein [Candidatus Angelobacter sp.]